MNEGFVTDFETGEDRVEVEERAAFLGVDIFLLGSCLALSFFNFFSFLKSGFVLFSVPPNKYLL